MRQHWWSFSYTSLRPHHRSTCHAVCTGCVSGSSYSLRLLCWRIHSFMRLHRVIWDRSSVCIIVCSATATIMLLQIHPPCSSPEPVSCSISIRVLGVTIDQHLTFANYVNKLVQSCNYHIRGLRHIRQLIDKDMANTLSCSIVGGLPTWLLWRPAIWHDANNFNSLHRVGCRNLSSDLCAMHHIAVHPSH